VPVSVSVETSSLPGLSVGWCNLDLMSDSPQISVTWAQALGWRLSRHLLDPVGQESVADVVRRLVAVPTMDEGLAELAVRTRRSRSRPGEAAQALADGRLIKAFAFRGAMHYLSPEDGGAYLALRAAGRQWELPSWQEHYRLTAAAWPDFRAAVREALADGPLTIGELGRAVTRTPAYRHLRPVFDDGAGTLVKPLTWQGDMSFGPSRDGHHTFQRLDTNPRWKGIWDLDVAGPYAVMTYARSYGPASIDGLQRWLGGTLSAGRKRIDGWFSGLVSQGRLVAVDLEGETAYVVPEDVDDLAAARPSSAVRFLPGHDQWVMVPGTKDEHVVPADRRTPVTRKANLVIAGGVVAGIWSVKGDELAVTWLDPSRPPTAALEHESTRLAELLDRPLELRVSTVV
jgi:hypothetical protein